MPDSSETDFETVQTEALTVHYPIPAGKETWSRVEVAELVCHVAESAYAQGRDDALRAQREAMSHTFN